MKNKEIESVLSKYTNKNLRIKELHSGHASRKWIIENETETMFLKELKNVSQYRVEFINYVQSMMQDYAPSIIRDKDKREYITLGNSRFILYEYIEGNKLKKEEMSLEELFAMGTFLGKVHKKMETINIPSNFTEITSLKITDNTIENMNNQVKHFEEKGNMQYASIIRYKIFILNNIKKENVIKATQELKKQIVHGDFYLDNILMADGRYYLLDFDQVGVFYKMYEVIRGMMMIAYNEKSSSESNIKRVTQFLNGYNQENTLENMDLSINLYLFTLANSMYCLSDEDFRSIDRRKFALTRFNMLKWLYDNKNKINRREIEENETTL